MAFIDKSIIQLLPGAIGALLSLQFVPRSFQHRRGKLWSSIISLVLGMSLSYYLGGATVEYFHMMEDSLIAKAVHFCFGLFGLSIVVHAMAEIRPTLDAIRNKILGEHIK